MWRTETLAIPEAVLGVRRTVPTLDGSVDVTIPAGTQSGIEVRVPKRLTKKQRELYAALQSLEAESRSELGEDARQRAAR